MSTGGSFLDVDPFDLRFLLVLNKQNTCSFRVSNKTDDHVAFKVKTTNPKNYCVRPNSGVLQPRAACDVTVTMQAQKEVPVDLQCKDKFLVQSTVVDSSVTSKEVVAEMFTAEAGKVVEGCKLRVVYVIPPETRSPGREDPMENASGSYDVSTSSNLATSLYSVIQDENPPIQENIQLPKIELPRQQLRKQHKNGNQPFVLVMIIAVLAILLGSVGYITKK